MITLAGPADAGKKVQIGMMSGQAQLQEMRRQAQLQAKPLSSEEREAIQRRREAACQSRHPAPSGAARGADVVAAGGRAAELQDILRRRREASEVSAAEAAARPPRREAAEAADAEAADAEAAAAVPRHEAAEAADAEAAGGPAGGGGPCAVPAPLAEAADCHADQLDVAAIKACPRPRAELPASGQRRPPSAEGAAQPAPRAEPPVSGPASRRHHPSGPSAEGAARAAEETPIVRSSYDDVVPTEIDSTRPPSGDEALLAGMAAKLDEHYAATQRDMHAARQLRNEAASFALCVERLRERLREARASLGQPAQALCCCVSRGNEDPA